MKKVLFCCLLILHGCVSTGGVEPKSLSVGRHKVVIHPSEISMQNAYVMRNGDSKIREIVTGFFEPTTNTLHCVAPWVDECLLHEYKHLLVKYGLVVDHPHFKKKD